MEKYIEHPYMQKFFDGKTQKNLADIVKLIDSGDADEFIEDEVGISSTKKPAAFNASHSKFKMDKKEKKKHKKDRKEAKR